MRKELLSTPNLRMICSFTKRLGVPSESTVSRAFAEYASAGMGGVVHDALVKEHSRKGGQCLMWYISIRHKAREMVVQSIDNLSNTSRELPCFTGDNEREDKT